MFDESPALVIALIEGLPDTSNFAAELMFDPPTSEHVPSARDFRGWGKDRHMLASLYDITLMAAAGKKYKKTMAYPRPKPKTARRSLRSLIPPRAAPRR